MATIHDVARLAGVSTSTVSRVLSRSRAVHPESARKVLAAAEQLGYRANLHAQAIARGPSTGGATSKRHERIARALREEIQRL
jgi:LacI family transcriptional regulator